MSYIKDKINYICFLKGILYENSGSDITKKFENFERIG
jgi:hypothetical protein